MDFLDVAWSNLKGVLKEKVELCVACVWQVVCF